MYTPSDFERSERSPGLGKRRQSDLSSIQPRPEDAVRRRISEEAELEDGEHEHDEDSAGQVEGASARNDRNGNGSMSLVDELDAAPAEEPEAGPSLPLGIARNGLPSPSRGIIVVDEPQQEGGFNLDAEGTSC